MIVITGIRAGMNDAPQAAVEKAVAELGVKDWAVQKSHIIKASVDARRKENITLVYSVGLELGIDEEAVVKKVGKENVTLRTTQPHRVVLGKEPLRVRPVIVGFGPAGMFAGLALAKNGYCPLILERGANVDERVRAVEGFWSGKGLNTTTNVQFGEGGAGTFSDGKLTTRIGDRRCEEVLRQFVRFGAPEEILYKAKPHIGTDVLRGVVKAIRAKIIALGGEVRFLTALEDLELGSDGLRAITANGVQQEAQVLVLAVGHSARDTFAMLLRRQLQLQVKPFSVGVRIEHLQAEIDKSLFGKLAGHPALGKGEYQLSQRCAGRAVYTFCMCPGGTVVPAASEEGGVVVNGMSEFARDKKNANAALVVSVDGKDFGENPADAIAFQRKLEQAAFAAGGAHYAAPIQTVAGFLKGTAGFSLGRVEPSYAVGVTPANLQALFPPEIAKYLGLGLHVFEGKLHGFAAPDAVLTGIETRTSSPVRMLRTACGEAVGAGGIYPCGEGAGYAGGILSAAVDGLKIAEDIMNRYGPF